MSRGNNTRMRGMLMEPDWKRFVDPAGMFRPYNHKLGTGVVFGVSQPLYIDFILDCDKYYDIRIIGKDGNSVMAHKMVVGSASPFIRNMFDDQPPGEVTVINLPDIPMYWIQRLLDIAYTGTTKVMQADVKHFQSIMQMLGFAKLNYMFPNNVLPPELEELDESTRDNVLPPNVLKNPEAVDSASRSVRPDARKVPQGRQGGSAVNTTAKVQRTTTGVKNSESVTSAERSTGEEVNKVPHQQSEPGRRRQRSDSGDTVLLGRDKQNKENAPADKAQEPERKRTKQDTTKNRGSGSGSGSSSGYEGGGSAATTSEPEIINLSDDEEEKSTTKQQKPVSQNPANPRKANSSQLNRSQQASRPRTDPDRSDLPSGNLRGDFHKVVHIPTPEFSEKSHGQDNSQSRSACGKFLVPPQRSASSGAQSMRQSSSSQPGTSGISRNVDYYRHDHKASSGLRIPPDLGWRNTEPRHENRRQYYNDNEPSSQRRNSEGDRPRQKEEDYGRPLDRVTTKPSKVIYYQRPPGYNDPSDYDFAPDGGEPDDRNKDAERREKERRAKIYATTRF